ncbi:MAG TPA: response regulator [Gemmataceae bacterium]|nr:response regulator [Gemmataceae bacterium]
MISPVSRSHPPSILLVEDDELVRDAMYCTLVREGYLVHTAATGHDAIGLLKTPLSPIDVVLLDIKLPDVSGIDLCARLREMYPDLPVVVCTGQADPDEAAELLKLGVHRYFCKPIAMDELLATVEAALP